ncbi:MAG: GNAT family N-acetyltransferase [Lutibacter sp.]|uniref:GNAT family N-acetyltransferase n=1 Tax=Lutibacter sp. TaxID=1925666 RepID=UPI00385A3BDE
MIQIKKISAQETYEVRLKELREHIPLSYKFNGDFDKNTFHLGAFKSDKLIAVSSFMKVNNTNFIGEQYQLRGMATLSKFQGYGAGKLMLQEGFSILKGIKIDYLWCNARIIAVDFYKKQGFKIFGELFNLKYVGDHYVMYKNLNE